MFNPSSQIYPKLNDFNKLAYQADSTPIRQRDTTVFFTILKRALSYNAKLFGHYNVRKSAVSSFTYSITAVDKKNQLKADAAKLRLQQAVSKLLDNQLKTICYGSLLAAIEVLNTPQGNRIVINKIFEPTEYDYDDNIFYLYNPGGKQKGYTSYDGDNTNNFLFDFVEFPHRGGLLRSIMPAEILRMDMLLEEANYLRKLKGILQIVNKGGSQEDQAAAQQAAQNVILDNFFISSDYIDLKLNQIASGQNSASFLNFRDAIDNSIAIALLGNANTSELPKYAGSRAALQVQRMISADIFYTDMNRAENLINKLLLIDFKLNYNVNAELNDLPWRFTFNLAEEQDIEKNAAAISELRRADIPLLKSEIYSKIGFTAPQQGDELLEPLKQMLL